MSTEHVLILGATGETSIVFLNQYLSLNTKTPLLTLYIRASGRSKLPKAVESCSTIRIVEGGLTDRAALVEALSADGSFPQVTTVLSFLGAYVSFYYFLTRQKPTPITDAFNSTILPAMREVGVKRIFALSTPSAFQYPEETAKMTWGVWLGLLPPKVIVPQGNAEMAGIAQAVILAGAADSQLEWTVFRVPFLTHEDPNAEVSVGEMFKDFRGTTKLTRGSLSKWLFAELTERKHVRRAPAVGNVAA
jgi:hypothetical protein